MFSDVSKSKVHSYILTTFEDYEAFVLFDHFLSFPEESFKTLSCASSHPRREHVVPADLRKPGITSLQLSDNLIQSMGRFHPRYCPSVQETRRLTSAGPLGSGLHTVPCSFPASFTRMVTCRRQQNLATPLMDTTFDQ